MLALKHNNVLNVFQLLVDFSLDPHKMNEAGTNDHRGEASFSLLRPGASKPQ
jgi:hypothetical protein